MDITIRDDTWYVLNMQLTTRRDYYDIPGAGPYKDAGSACMVACGQHLRSLGMDK